MRSVGFPCLLFLVWGTFPVAAETSNRETPTHIVEGFYDVYLKLGVSGLPDRKQSEALGPFLSRELRELLTLARQRQAAEIRRHPGDKPPWDDGDLFSSLFEGAQYFKVDAASVSTNNATVRVHLRRDGTAVIRWTDTFVLTLTTEGWCISNITMGGEWAFKRGKTLRKILTAH
jgi:hypothetical protein